MGQSYGVGTPDKVTIFLIPFGLLKAEPMPTWFTKKKRNKPRSLLQAKPFFSPGFAGNGLLLIWTVAGSFISMAFLSNVRAMLMIPVYEAPVHTTRDIFKEQKVPYVNLEGSFWREYLLESPNWWERLAGEEVRTTHNSNGLSSGERGITFKAESDRDAAIVEMVTGPGDSVIFENQEIVAYLALSHPELKERTPPIFHLSKSVIRSGLTILDRHLYDDLQIPLSWLGLQQTLWMEGEYELSHSQAAAGRYTYLEKNF